MSLGDRRDRQGETAGIRPKEEINTIPGQEAQDVFLCQLNAATIVMDNQPNRHGRGDVIDPEAKPIQGLLPL